MPPIYGCLETFRKRRARSFIFCLYAGKRRSASRHSNWVFGGFSSLPLSHGRGSAIPRKNWHRSLKPCMQLSTERIVNQTIQYLQSESAEQGIEIDVLVTFLLMDSISAGASDIHIEPWESTWVVRIRLSGVLTELVHLPLELMEKISGRFKVMASLISYQTGLPQEGHASAGPEMGGGELRISIFPTVGG